MAESEVERVIIIGSGPAAHTAALYTGRAELKPLLFEGFMAGGVAAGGQLTTTTEVENFPGFPESIGGPELMDKMREQATKYGARIITETVTKVDFSRRPFRVYVDAQEYRAHAVIVATGATAKRLNLPGEETYWQKGISACAVCDGALPVFRNNPLVVIGGGDTACEEASFLTKFGSSVTILVRRDQMRASKAMQSRVAANKKITIMWNTVATRVVGEKFMTGIEVRNVKTGQEQLITASGLFYAIGHEPNTVFLGEQLSTDETGYIVAQPDSTKTSIAGVFACGDVKDKVYRQAITAAGSGCMAAIEAEHYLAEIEGE
ncbi:MAG TPA: thioredoxin-disulfide reductase [Spirochaetia bacterium]|nr:thioredoxin-disulfide reductase [Spirochaetia bacterium]